MNIFNKQYGVSVIKFIALTPLILIGLVVLAFIFTLLNKAYWDYRVEKMCEKDGGVTVYEKVELTQEEYKKYGGIKGAIRVPPKTASDADEYLYLYRFEEKEIINKSNPSVYRWEATIYDKSNNKAYGKVVSYHRGGGDFPTIIGHPSGFDCKDIGIELGLRQFFILKEKNNEY